MFKVPIIPPDLRHEETITQAAYALDCLQTTISTIFGQIDKRIKKNNDKVIELQERIKKSQAKINSLQGTSKAIHIYAPARFPATNVLKDLPITFKTQPTSKQNTEHLEDYQIQSKLEANLPNASEKLIFFHVRDYTLKLADNCVAKELYNIHQNYTLGNMPSDLRSIPSVLLFNTNYSLYLTNEFDSETDAWKRAKLFKNKRQLQTHNQQITIKQVLEPAPHSLANRRNEKLTPSGGMKYTPKLSEAPELDLPLDLPDLPGIADDMRYESQEAKQKIAPSLALAVQNLPELTELIKENPSSATCSVEDFERINTTTQLPPPPPPLPAATKATISTPPPPPPPPMPPTQPSPQRISNHFNTSTSQTTPSSSDKRSELMAAIRNAGGVGKAHLRRTAAAPLATNDKDNVDNNQNCNSSAKNQNSCSPHSGDLMADLHNKLLMRRKGISGSKLTTENNNENIKHNYVANIPSGNPVISRLSSLIPPPPNTDKGRNQHTINSSEDDEDDSNDTDWVD